MEIIFPYITITFKSWLILNFELTIIFMQHKLNNIISFIKISLLAN